MTTTVTNSIGTASRTYSTIQAWEDACPANLVTSDQVWKGETYNDAEFTAGVVFAGTTTDATRYLWLTTAAGQSFMDHASKTTNPLKYDQTKGVGIQVTGSYQIIAQCTTSGMKVVVEKIQAYFNSTNNSNYFRPYEGVHLNNVLLESKRTAGGTVMLKDVTTLTNSIFIERGATFSGESVSFTGSTPSGCVIANVTVVRPRDLTAGGTGINRNGTAEYPIIKNCRVFGFTTMYGGTIASYVSGSTDNASSVVSGSIPGANTHASLTYSAQFVGTTDTARDFRAAASSQVGTRDATNTADLDIIGQARSTSTPTTGAWEYISGGGGAFTPNKRKLLLGAG